MTEEWLNQVEDAANTAPRKVYCNTCVYYREATPRSDDRCQHPSAQVMRESYRQRSVSYERPSVRNQQNDCADYEWHEWSLAHEWRRIREAGDAPFVVLGLCGSVGLLLMFLYAFFR